MSSDAKSAAAPTPAKHPGHKGVRIFTYPKVIFLVPSLVTALVCGFGMLFIADETRDPHKFATTPAATATAPGQPAASAPAPTTTTPATADTPTAERGRRFSSTQNVLGIVFLSIFFINLVVMSIDFPRFTVLGLMFLVAAIGFFLLWLNVYFELLPPVVIALESIYTVANSGFYFMFATILLVTFAVIWVTRYLDYWEVLPNEILHNHGPFSDLERYPTQNLKFDKEIPDIFEYALLRSGRLVLHIPNQARAVVLENVLWINTKEEELKKLLSRMEVRITTDQEASQPI